MTVATRRTLRSLQLGTALATTLFAGGLAMPAFGQSLPVVNNAGGATITTNATDQQINLNDANRVINFDSYDVAAGNTVNYLTGNTTNQYAVLNRVVGANFSSINGAVTGQNNIVVWLSNPNGILVGATGSFNTGGLVLTTLGIADADFTDGSGFNLAGSGTTAISLSAGSSLVTSGSAGGFAGGLILAAPQIVASGTISGSADVALVAAQDVSFTTGIGSPLALTINAGTKVATMVDVDSTAAISGKSIALVAASDATIVGALLNVDAGASLTATGTNGAVILGTKDVASIAVPEHGDAIVANGSLTASGTGGDVIVAAAGLATVGGAVSAKDLYTVSGASVTLGSGTPVTQSAGLNVDVTATGGNITGASGLTLTSNSADGTNGYVVLDAGTTGRIAFAPNTAIVAGPDANGPVGLIYDTTQDLALGDVTAATLGRVSGTAGVRNTFNTSLNTTGTADLTLGDITVVNALANYTAGGDMRIGSIDAGEINLTTGGDLTGLTGASTGTSDPNFGRADLKARIGTVTATAGGLAQLGAVAGQTGIAITAGSAVTPSNGSIDATSLVTNAAGGTGGNIQLTGFANAPIADPAHDGDILVGSANAFGSFSASNSAGDTGNVLVSGDLVAGNAVSVDADDTATVAGNVTAGTGAYTISGTNIVLGNASSPVTQSAGGAVSLTPTGGGIALAGDVTLASTGGAAISLNGAVDGAQALTLNTSGATNLGDVGATTALTSITTDAGGTTELNGGTVTTSGAQTFGDTVNLRTSVTATGTTGTAAAVDGHGNDLTLNYTGLTFINGNVTGVNNLATGNGGTTALTGTISTSGTQTYNDAVVLGGTTVLASSNTSAAANITFGSSVNGAQSLTVNTAGATTFTGPVGTGTALASLTTDLGGATAINGGLVATTGAQSYGDAVSLGQDTTLSGATGSFSAGITGNNHDLTLSFTGTSAIDGSVQGVQDLVADGGGTTQLTGNITTFGSQTYNDAVVLTGTTALSSVNNGPIQFANTVDSDALASPRDLTVTTSGLTSFLDDVGMTFALASLTTNGGGTTDLNGGTVTTTGAQTYSDNVRLTADATLTSTQSGAIAFQGTIDSDGTARALTLSTAGPISLGDGAGDTVGASSPLASLTTTGSGSTAINGGSVTTVGGQSYGGDVSLGADTSLNGTTAMFGGAIVGGGRDLTLNFSGATTVTGTLTGVDDLLTTAGGTTRFNGGTVSTAGTQTFNDQVILGAGTTFIGTTGAFNAGLAGMSNDLTLTYSGPSSLTGAFTGIDDLVVDGGSTTALSGSVSTVGGQTYFDAITLAGDTTLSSSNAGNIAFESTVAGGQALTVNTGGITRFQGAVGGGGSPLASLTTDAGGTTQVNGGAVTTTGAQTFGDQVVLGNSATFTGTTGAFNAGLVGGGNDLTLDYSGTSALNGTFTGVNNLTTGNGGTTQLSGNITTAGSQTFNDTVQLTGTTVLASSGNGPITFVGLVDSDALGTPRDLTVTTSGLTEFRDDVGSAAPLASLTTNGGGVTDLNGGTVTTSGAQTYADDVVLTADTLLTSTANGAIGFQGKVDSDTTARALTVTTGGLTTFGDALGDAVGGTAPLASLTVNGGGTTALNGGAVTTSGDQTYTDALSLGAATTLTGVNGTISNGVTGNGNALTLSFTGLTSLAGTSSGLASLTSNNGGTTDIAGSITTTGDQTYADAVTLSGAVALTAGNASTIAFNITLDGPGSLTASAGTLTLGGPDGNTSPLAGLTAQAALTNINGGLVATTGAQDYTGAVRLGANTVLSSSGGAQIRLQGATDAASAGGQSLTVNTTGATVFGGPVGGSAALSSLTTNVGGTTAINGGAVTTTGAQSYNDAVTLGAATTLTSTGSGNIAFASTLDGAQTLAINTGGVTSFGGIVGGTDALTSLSTDAAGSTQINTSAVSTTGNQSYGDAVTLGVTTTLASNGGDIGFAATLDGPGGLTLNTTGTTTFAGAVGATTALASLSTDAGGTTAINGGSVRTSGAQTYRDAVTLGAATTTLSSTGGGALNFASTSTLDGASALTLTTSGDTTLSGTVGATTPLTSLTSNGGGTTQINTATVRTTGAQTYADAVTVLSNATLTSTMNGAVTFQTSLDGPAALTVNTGGTTSFLGAVGATTALASLTTDAGGETDINGLTVTTTGAQSYGDAVVLSADATLTSTGGGAIGFASTVNSQTATPRALTVNTVGATTFGGAVGTTNALASLTTDAPGSTALNGGAVTTTGAQTYNDPVTLGVDTTLNAGTDITFAAALNGVNGTQGLTATAGGAVSLNGTTGGTSPLEYLTIGAASARIVDAIVSGAAQITTSGNTQVGSLTAGSIAITGDQVTGLGAGNANLSATAGGIGVTAGALARLGTISASGAISVTGDAVSVDNAAAGTSLALASDVGSLTLGTGNAGTTATLTKTGATGELTVSSLTGGTGVTISSATNVRVANATATTGNLSVTATGAVTGIAGARGDLAATTGSVTATAGANALLGAVNAGTSASLTAGTSLDVTTVTAGTNATLQGASVTAGTVTATSGALSATATGGDLTLGTGDAGTTAALTASGDIVLTGKLIAGGNITLSAGDDVVIAAYDQAGDTGYIRSIAGDVAIDANGSVYAIGGAENGLPTTQRGVAALSTSGNLTINSDGDARFDSLAASGSLSLNIAGSLTGSPLTGGSATGTNVTGAAIFAQGAGGDVTIRSGLAGTPTVDVVVLNRVVADRNITINADQLAIGTLTTNSGTITLNDTSGAALTSDNYYVGQLNASGDLIVNLTGQPTAAIPLVAADMGGAPESLDASFGKTDLTAGTSLTGSIGRAAQLSDVAFGTTLDVDTAALVADTLTSSNGSADITASTGTLSILTTQLGGALTLRKQGGAAATPGDELRARSATVGGNATLASSTHQRIGALNSGGAIVLTAINDVTGLAGASSGTSDTNFGRANLSASGALTATLGGLAQLGTASAGGAISVTAGTATSDGSIDASSVQAGGALALVATAIAPVTDAGHDGDIRLGTATAGTTLLVSNVINGGDSGNIVASGAIQAGGDSRIDAANDATLAAVTTTGGSLGVRARRDVTTANLAASEDIGVSAGRNAALGALSAGDDVLVTAAGSLTVASASAGGTGPDTRTVSFASPSAITFPAETSPGADIVLTSTGSSVTANGALSAVSDVTVNAATSAALLGSTTATAGNVTVASGTSSRLVGDVSSGINTTVAAGTTATIQQNVTAGGSYIVTGGTGVALGDALARTQQARGAVTITATSGDVTQGAGRLTIVSNSDQAGTETLTIAANAGNIVLANSQLTGGSLAGRESDVVLNASGAITADDLDGDRVGLTAGGNIVADTIEAGTGAADLGDLAQPQSVDLVSTGGSVSVNTAQAFGAGHDIDIRAAIAISANSLAAGGTIVGRAGANIAIGTATAGEDVAFKSNGGGITITGATTAGDDALLTAAGAISTGAVTASGTGPDTRTVTFGANPLDAAYAAETNPGADIVATSTGSSFTANGALAAARDVTVNANTSAALLGSTTATAGNVSVTSGTSSQLVGDVASAINTTVTAGTIAAIQQNVTAGGNYVVTGGTGVTLGDASARTQQANGNVTITATNGDVTKGAGRLTVVANADRTAANNTETLTISAANGNIVLASSQLTGGSVAGRESDVRLTARGITVGKVDGASLTARATTGFTAGEAITAGNAARGSDPINGASTVDVAVSGGPLSFTDITATNAGHDIVLNASGAISGGNLTAARSVIVNGGSASVTGATTATAGSVTVNGGSSAALGSLSAATTGAVTAGTINVGAATTGSTLNLNATGSTLTLGSATSGGDVTLAAATRATLGPITATGRNVLLSAADADVNGNIAAGTITVVDRAAGANALRLGDNAPGSGGFALSQAEVNRLNAATVTLDAGTTGGGAAQDVAIGALAVDTDTGSTRLDVLGLQRFDATGTISAMGNGARTFRLGGSATANTRATTMRFATMASGGGRVLVPGIALDLRADRIAMGFDAGFLSTLGLTPGGSPTDRATVAAQYIANGSSTLYNSDSFGAGAYSDQTTLTADSLTVRYSDYALFQNTGGTAANAGAMLASLADPSAPALVLMGPNPPDAGGFALFGTINGVPDSAAAVLGDQIITLSAVDRLNARVNGCVIGSGSGCIASTTGQPPLPPLNAFRGDIFSSQGDLSIPFDPVVGTNNESLFGDVGSFGLSDLPLQPLECDPDKEGDCAREGEQPPQQGTQQ